MNPQRLADLQRQRELARQQLAWLDREIAAEQSSPPADSSSAAAPASTVSLTAPESYQPDPITAAAQTKRGCLLGAALVLVAGALALVALYFLRYRDRPIFLADPPASAHRAAPRP